MNQLFAWGGQSIGISASASMDISLSKLQEIVWDGETWRAAVHGVEHDWVTDHQQKVFTAHWLPLQLPSLLLSSRAFREPRDLSDNQWRPPCVPRDEKGFCLSVGLACPYMLMWAAPGVFTPERPRNLGCPVSPAMGSAFHYRLAYWPWPLTQTAGPGGELPSLWGPGEGKWGWPCLLMLRVGGNRREGSIMETCPPRVRGLQEGMRDVCGQYRQKADFSYKISAPHFFHGQNWKSNKLLGWVL